MNPLINFDHVSDKPAKAAEWRAKLPEPEEGDADD